MNGIKLTRRVCKCGCGASFLVWPESSPNWFKNLYHAQKTLEKEGPNRDIAKKFFSERSRIMEENYGNRKRDIKNLTKGRRKFNRPTAIVDLC